MNNCKTENLSRTYPEVDEVCGELLFAFVILKENKDVKELGVIFQISEQALFIKI